MRFQILPAAAALAIAVAGCQMTETIEPAIAIEGKRLVVLPFKDSAHGLAHFESPRGTDLARRVTDILVEKRRELEEEAIDVVPFERMVEAVTRIHEEPQRIPFAAVGRAVNANLVLAGDIESFEPRLKGDVGILRGRARAAVRLVEVANERAWELATIAVTFPPAESIVDTGVMAPTEGAEEDIVRGLERELGDRIAKLFYVHERERQPGYRAR